MCCLAIALVGLAACAVDADLPDVDPGTIPAAACATPRVEAWTGTASRIQDHYPDDITATVTWRRIESNGCVDRYAPSGTAHYGFAIPGAQCSQTIAPDAQAIGAADGLLTIDRSTAPATYSSHAATTWRVTFTCRFEDGSTETSELDGGGLWMDASGAVGARLEGQHVLEDGSSCGQGSAGTPCTYAWAFDAAP